MISLFSTMIDTFGVIIATHWKMFLLLGVLSIVGKALRRPSVKGRLGEGLVNHAVLRRLNANEYTVYHDFYLPRPDGRGTAQLDHVVVSAFGIFVIETKHMKGWIFGDESSPKWTQSIYGKKRSFQNPLHQNDLHVHALMELLPLSAEAFHSLVFFTGDAVLKTRLPRNVATRGFRSMITKHRERILSPETVSYVNATLSADRFQKPDRNAKARHVAGLKEIHGPGKS